MDQDGEMEILAYTSLHTCTRYPASSGQPRLSPDGKSFLLFGGIPKRISLDTNGAATLAMRPSSSPHAAFRNSARSGSGRSSAL